MNRRNYARELERIMESSAGKKPTLLLHACCGPCSSGVLEYIKEHFEITLLWYNPNIYPEAEFEKRLATLNEMLEKLGLSKEVKVIECFWRNEEFEAVAKGLEAAPEGGERCAKCFELRLEETAKKAKELNFDCFCTTLTVSRHKDAVRINAIGESLGEKYGVSWLPSDFKKRNGENRSQELSARLGLYRQLYCGCRYSLVKRENQN